MGKFFPTAEKLPLRIRIQIREKGVCLKVLMDPCHIGGIAVRQKFSVNMSSTGDENLLRIIILKPGKSLIHTVDHESSLPFKLQVGRQHQICPVF